MPSIFHITSTSEIDEAGRTGAYAPRAFGAEGFIHCSHAHQVAAVANRLFGGRPDLVLLEIDPGRLTCKVIEENLEGGAELFPHVYGQLPLSAVVTVHTFPCGPDRRFYLPPAVEGGPPA